MDGNGIRSRITANASSNFPSLMRRIYRGTSIPAGQAHWQGGAVVSAFETCFSLMRLGLLIKNNRDDELTKSNGEFPLKYPRLHKSNFEIPNSRHQITNNPQIPILNVQNI
jgi:hypothetical protein